MLCAIVTAAGRSRRMGTQKLLLPYAGGTVIGRVVSQLHQSAVDRVFVITAEARRDVSDALAAFDVVTVSNPDPDPECEMLETIRCGLRALPAECDQILIALGDQPSITSELINRLVTELRENPRSIVVPVHQQKRGHPVLFDACFKSDVLSHFEGEGLRGLLQAHPDRVREVSVPEHLMLADIDSPEDYQRELAKLDAEQRRPG
jgi:molybdenum cofactor cytidylyltransferase